ncbi:lysylphosphatidylglycerol synthase transmembrane domain-containing protein [Tengunoibacter tsumagoiensis]|uniref:Flippase-like domain-containing protein n=1 Tax=Tengunoibacter tsumagoiensis TaxID=2014871 RepID=A0A402A0T3_9CHLR|nr:lysylphosphatidylglycerol synthase transmembrane domain-containing protein [Tengunoibacter tsumagoiensis]GCE12621.1 hypothetical protein KTT_24800 [Tengunoibacter tsumagoiensis]
MGTPFLTQESPPDYQSPLPLHAAERSHIRPPATPPQHPERSRWLKFALRLSCTVLLFVFLLRSVSWTAVVQNILHLDTGLLLIGLVLGMFGVIVSAYQWQSLLDTEQIHWDLRRLVNLYLVGHAFNHFLPTGMGGDIVKAYYVGKESKNAAGSASAVLLSRGTGFIGMLAVSIPSVIIWHGIFSREIIWLFLLSSILLCAILGAAYGSVLLLPRFLKIHWLEHKMISSLLRVGQAIRGSLSHPRSMAIAVGYGLIFHLISALNYYAYATALHLQVPFAFYLVAIPFVSLIAFLPFAINGYGLRETAFVSIFATMHVPVTTALVLVLLADAQGLLLGALGGCIYLLMGARKKEISDSSLTLTSKELTA